MLVIAGYACSSTSHVLCVGVRGQCESLVMRWYEMLKLSQYEKRPQVSTAGELVNTKIMTQDQY